MNLKKQESMIVERAAPSPTGGLHLGHVYSTITAYRNAKINQGLFKLRIEDIDTNRCRLNYEKEIISNLIWLGLKFDGKIMRQRDRKKNYAAATKQLLNQGLIYPCVCTRSDIKNASTAPHADEKSPLIYPGTCKKSLPEKPVKALRLDIRKALKFASTKRIVFLDNGVYSSNNLEEHSISSETLEHTFGDFIIVRKDIGTSYNLSVVIDDAAQSVTHVTRGDDLLPITPIQVLLQKILSLPTPQYHHHRLLYEKNGKKISKRSSPQSVKSLKLNGLSPNDVIDLAFSLA